MAYLVNVGILNDVGSIYWPAGLLPANDSNRSTEANNCNIVLLYTE